MLKMNLITAILLAANTAFAAPSAENLILACLKLDNGTPIKCACMAETFVKTLSDDEQVYAHAMMTLNESELEPLNGSLKDDMAEKTKEKMIPLMMGCLL